MLLGATLTLALAGCQPGANPAPSPAPRAGDAVGAPTSIVSEVRRSKLAVPKGMALLTMEFADASHGYAAFVSEYPVSGTGDDARYASSLFATVDGGRTWKQLADPRRPSRSPQLYTVDARTIVLLADPYAWYVSRDGGATFSQRPDDPAPPELDSLQSPYRLDCADGCVIKRYDGHSSTLLAQPTLPGDLGAVIQAGDSLWAASLDASGTPFTATSRDGGKSWQRRDVPAHDGGRPTRVNLQVSPDGGDVWLVGYLVGPIPGYHRVGGGLGSALPLRRKDLGVPLLWLREGDRWVPKGTVGAPEPSQNPFAVAAVGGGLAAVTGPHGLALVDGAWHEIQMSPRPEWVTALRDGTVVAAAPTNGSLFLGRRSGRDLSWVEVAVSSA